MYVHLGAFEPDSSGARDQHAQLMVLRNRLQNRTGRTLHAVHLDYAVSGPDLLARMRPVPVVDDARLDVPHRQNVAAGADDVDAYLALGLLGEVDAEFRVPFFFKER